KDVRALLSAMDLFILPSLFEGTPVSVVEALASGLPCLLSDTVTRSLSAGGVRYLSIKADPRVWAEEGMALMNERKDHDRSDLREVAALGLDLAKVGKALEEYYMGLVKNDERGI
ncbi:MAG: glycosyltransferase, partial [Firmicutes bacterium]|nr:glycosyltransferase [Bacillota bacterium]